MEQIQKFIIRTFKIYWFKYFYKFNVYEVENIMLEIQKELGVSYMHNTFKIERGTPTYIDFMISYNEEIEYYHPSTFHGKFINIRFRKGVVCVYVDSFTHPGRFIIDFRKIIYKKIINEDPLEILKSYIIIKTCKHLI